MDLLLEQDGLDYCVHTDVVNFCAAVETIVNNAIPACTKITAGSIRFGNTIAPPTAAVATLEICVNLCLNTKDCMFASWNVNLKTCVLLCRIFNIGSS